MSKEFINIKIEKEVFEILKYWSEKRKEENSDEYGTREPIYKVQKRSTLISSKEFQVDQIEIVLVFNGDTWCFQNIDEIKENINEDYFSDEDEFNLFDKALLESDNIEELQDKLESISIENFNSYICYLQENWIDMGYFLTKEEAENFREYQSHNLGVSRVYIDYPGYGNKGTLNKFLEIIDNNILFVEV